MSTIAEQVATEMGGDGQQFTAPDGRTLDDVCAANGATAETNFDLTTYTFPDGSQISDQDGRGWDVVGCTSCGQWVGGLPHHQNNCPEGQQNAGRA